MPRGPRRRGPRAPRLVIDVLHAVYDSRELIQYWDITRRDGGVLLRARSRRRYATEAAMAELAEAIAERVRPHGYDVRDVSAVAQTDGSGQDGWHAFVEVHVS